MNLINHCQNKGCLNFTSNHDLAGSWCQDVCFMESESGIRLTRQEELEMKVDYDWDLDEFERADIQKLCIVKSKERLRND